MKLTALGWFVGVHFTGRPDTPLTWHCVAFGKNGKFSVGSMHRSEAEAKKERARLYAIHRKIAAGRRV